jgi:hypothetical protein
LADDAPEETTQPEDQAAAAEAEATETTDATETAAEAVEPEAAPALDEHAARMLERLQAELGDAIVEHGATYGDAVVRVRPDAWLRSARFCKDELGCDYLSFISAID